MRVLSLFDGLGGARVALDLLGIVPKIYYASEIDKYAISVATNNYSDIVELGNVENITSDMVGNIDLLIGGSPCQDLSIAKSNRLGLNGQKSGLFWHYVRLLETVKPKYFLLENVASMSKTERDKISEVLSYEPILINSALVTAQNRKRYYWTNIPNVVLPQDRNLHLNNIVDFNLKGIMTYEEATNRKGFLAKKCAEGNIKKLSEKSKTLTAQGVGISNKSCTHVMFDDGLIRKLTPIEWENLQGLPKNYTLTGVNNEQISDRQRYKMIGNGFTTLVIAHILSSISEEFINV